MLRLRYLKPGQYRIISVKDYWNSITNFVIYRLIDGQVDYSDYSVYVNYDHDTDLDFSSISTGPEFLGDHPCSQHRVRSYGEKTYTTVSGDGYSRTIYDSSNQSRRDKITSLSTGKAIYDYPARSWTESSWRGRTQYRAKRSELSTYYWWLSTSSDGRWTEYECTTSLSWENGKLVRVSHQVYHDSSGKTYNDQTNRRVFQPNGHDSISIDIIVNDPIPNFSDLFRSWDYMLLHLMDNAAQPPKADEFGAALEAARDFNAYDINLIEALAGFGLDDLYPKRLSKSLYQELSEFVRSPSLTTALSKTAYLAATTYLYNKYVVGNNIADIEQLLGLSGSRRFADASAIAEKLASSLSDDEQSNWDFRLAKMARKIVYKWDYLQDSYGGVTRVASNGFDTVTRTNRAHLQATPGPLRDMTASAIILDDIGLSLRASRLAQAVKLEFIANWFLPIEENLDRLEFNQAHLNQLYSVKKLCLSDKVTHRFDFETLKYLYGLAVIDNGEISVCDYNRYTREDFPPTSFQFRPDGSVTLSRILQGSALIITSLH